MVRCELFLVLLMRGQFSARGALGRRPPMPRGMNPSYYHVPDRMGR